MIAAGENTMKNIFAGSIFGILITTIFASNLSAQTGPYQYNSVTPCRVVDTRGANSTNGGPILLGVTQRDFKIRGNCGIPLTAQAVSINVTVVSPTQGSWLAVWPSGLARPLVSTINFDQTSGALANGAIVGLSQNTNDLSVYNSDGSVHVLIDVTGYFQ
jgi:hypothetical protein